MTGGFAVVQVGGGLWGQSWAELVARGRGARLTALVDRAKTVRDWASRTLGCPTFSELGAALGRARCQTPLPVKSGSCQEWVSSSTGWPDRDEAA